MCKCVTKRNIYKPFSQKTLSQDPFGAIQK